MKVSTKERRKIRAYFFYQNLVKPSKPKITFIKWLSLLVKFMFFLAIIVIVTGIVVSAPLDLKRQIMESILRVLSNFGFKENFIFWFKNLKFYEFLFVSVILILSGSFLKLVFRIKKRKRQHKENLKIYADDIRKYKGNLNNQKEYLKKWNLDRKDLSKIPTGKQIDNWFQRDIDDIVSYAMHRLDLQDDQLVRNPQVLYGPIFWETPGIENDEIVYVKDSKDEFLRFSCYQIVVILLSDTRIAVYQANFNFLRYIFVGERAVEYLYRDIVAVSTEEEATSIPLLMEGKTLSLSQKFRLEVASGSNIEIILDSPEIRNHLEGVPKLTSHDKTVRVIREMLRDKKG